MSTIIRFFRQVLEASRAALVAVSVAHAQHPSDPVWYAQGL